MKSRWILCCFALFSLVGCGKPFAPPAEVVATTGMIADAVQQITRGKVQVACLMGPGVDPHKFLPSAGDLESLSSAKLILYNGLHLEGKMVDVLEKPRKGRKAVAVTARLDEQKDLRKAEVDGGAHDPHVWFDVKLWSKCVETIRDELCEAFPQHAEEFRANAKEYLAELAALDAEVKKKAASLPKERRVLVTSHDAFGYFGAAYGFEVHGLQGVSTAASSATNDVEELSQMIRTKKVPAIFTETSVPTQGLKQVLDTVQSQDNRKVRLIGGDDALYSDALGDAGSAGASYIGMVRHNIDVIVKALAE